ncbi:MAG TPA: AAA family ATPase [Nitrososphaera sp.]
MKKFRLVITGNPGVGKHTSARLVAKKTVAEIIDINSIAIEEGAILKKTGRGLDVDVKRLTGQLGRLLRSKDDLVIVGHLAPYVLKPAGIDMAAVLRRSPYELQKTLEGRQYDYSKVRENVSSEILGVSFYDSVKAFGKRKVAEFDTTGRTPEQTADEIVATLRGKSPKRTGFVDWLALISEKDDIQKFFDY